MSASRRTKWQPPPPPAPKILQLPRRIRLQPHTSKRPAAPPEPTRNLRSLFNEEKTNGACEKERWKAEAEMLRAECDYLRMERDAALQKLEKTRERKKIDGTDSIEKKMGKLKVRSREVDGEVYNVREIREIEGFSTLEKHKQVEMLKRKMEGLSRGLLERMEEYGSFLVSADNGQSQKRIGFGQEVAGMANQRQVKEAGTMGHRCGCNCKEIVARIAEEVKAESKQWTEMQEMLDQVRLEMEDLKLSRDLWQRRASASELNLRALYSHMLEWKRRARASEHTVGELQKHIFQREKSSRAESVSPIISPSQNANSDNWDPVRLPRIKCQQLQQRSPDYSVMEKEKHVLVCRLNNSKSKYPRRRCPLQEIGNLSAT